MNRYPWTKPTSIHLTTRVKHQSRWNTTPSSPFQTTIHCLLTVLPVPRKHRRMAGRDPSLPLASPMHCPSRPIALLWCPEQESGWILSQARAIPLSTTLTYSTTCGVELMCVEPTFIRENRSPHRPHYRNPYHPLSYRTWVTMALAWASFRFLFAVYDWSSECTCRERRFVIGKAGTFAFQLYHNTPAIYISAR